MHILCWGLFKPHHIPHVVHQRHISPLLPKKAATTDEIGIRTCTTIPSPQPPLDPAKRAKHAKETTHSHLIPVLSQHITSQSPRLLPTIAAPPHSRLPPKKRGSVRPACRTKDEGRMHGPQKMLYLLARLVSARLGGADGRRLMRAR